MVVDVPGAIVTEFVARPTERRHHRTTVGAVHTAEGQLVPESQRAGGISGDHVVADDPTTTDVVPDTTLPGTWLYAGNWMAHFGHFVTETLTTLWPRDRQVDGVLAHPFFWKQREPTATQLALFRAAGFDGEPVIVDRDVRVERLLVPSRPFVPNAVAGPGAVRAWDAVASRVPRTPPRPVFLSRSAFHAAHLREKGTPHARALDAEDELDDVMRRRGFEVVHPQDLDVLDQVATVAGASVLAGVSGSALLLAAFAGEHTRVLEIGDPRSPAGLPNQHVVAAARGHRYAAVAHAPGPDQATHVDLDHVSAAMEHLGLSRVARRRWRRRRHGAS